MGLAEGGPWAALQACWEPATALQGSLSLPMTALPALCRWQQSAKSSGLASNLQPSGAKADALREEMEEAANRVEICRVPRVRGGSLLAGVGGPWHPRHHRTPAATPFTLFFTLFLPHYP